ncbi:aminotransferase class V-fold PLP-dependent enzyme [Butyricicoccus faecihominis]|uniref:O-acetylhomoserine aminocarboxypropyltransferase/cysteine synthase family protein n=1 Tax=Butyricicoccaceae TaxID=3085642 RepID=UPI00247A9D76|nr:MULTISPECIES: aminotransferase class V-fold PLP-dependent enzyme [Butyricicoccaceae]MCQ5130390.1 aminotransferase class V-fold PLP-dependent enzyme [Butyricicoccus faecihominis]WNX83821.1 aminotransferase class V-fold PLP-dependent enzyme [Agathobaculum sp. NTUH-O15-33]
MKIETKCLHEGYEPENGGARALPIYQSTTFKFDSTAHVGDLFDLTASGHFYTRLSNPTVAAVEDKISALEGGVGALCTSSGQAATMLAILNIAGAGDHIVSTSTIYGGSLNLLAVTFKKLGIDVTFVDGEATEDELEQAFRPNTKAVFGETIANPALTVLDIEKFAALAHRHNVPLIVDNTFATPVLCRPFEWGADIVVHSTTKYMDGHAVQMGGVIVDSGKFDWTKGNFPGLTEPDDSYHGLVYTDACGAAAYITKARVQLMRDMGTCQTPMGAFLLDLGLQTLPLRIRQHSANAMTVASYLRTSDKVDFVTYPGLAGDAFHDRAVKYLENGAASGVISFSLKGGREAAERVIDAFKLVSLEVHVADIHSCALHPASATHRQLTDEQLVAAGITPGLIRLSCGLENAEDIIADVEQALAQA